MRMFFRVMLDSNSSFFYNNSNTRRFPPCPPDYYYNFLVAVLKAFSFWAISSPLAYMTNSKFLLCSSNFAYNWVTFSRNSLKTVFSYCIVKGVPLFKGRLASCAGWRSRSIGRRIDAIRCHVVFFRPRGSTPDLTASSGGLPKSHQRPPSG
jgi:hypothetical protein